MPYPAGLESVSSAANSVGRALAGREIVRAERLLLLEAATGVPRVSLLADPDAVVDAATLARFEALIDRRRQGEPIAYLVGAREFFGRRFEVDRSVLIPRPETELLVERVLASIAQRPIDTRWRVVDLGTGSGAIAVTLALENLLIDAVATDVSEEALDVARSNASRLGAAVRFREGSWYDALDPDGRYDLIVSNPPYVAVSDPHLDEGDVRFEPQGALTGGDDGLRDLATIIGGAPAHLAPGGGLLVEHGYDQADRVRAMMRSAGLTSIASWRDLAGIERVSEGTAQPRGPSSAEQEMPGGL